ncbi:MAG: phenylalanine--tRNA ligase subunit beta [Candidatus Omnitrophica bacterium]|nr:phenylalanine--tRNA ligase subunit beta [Candidatus Omnitrophota bacterium]
MKFSLDFIHEFLKVDIPPQELAKFLTMAGMEVESLEKKKGDWIFGVEVTTNRYDWLSILGIAGEIAAILGKKARVDYPVIIKKPLLTGRRIIIEDKKDCPYYIGRRIEGVKVVDSPLWIKQRVINCGISPVNIIVDIANYSMLKWGNPLHTFDADKLEGDIYIRRGAKKESFIGIDGKKRILSQDNLVITDSKKVIALAGIMGAKNTEVDNNTKNVFLEAAIFSPLTIRRSRRVAGLDTESSYRFERAAPPHLLEVASCAAAKLIVSEAGGQSCGYRQAGKKPQLVKKKIPISLKLLNTYLGITPSKQKVKKILKSLNFEIKDISTDKMIVLPSVSRFDIKSDVDVYEEFSRIYGYDKIPAQLPFLKGGSCVGQAGDFYHFRGELANFAALSGFKEIVTYSLEEQEQLRIGLSTEASAKAGGNDIIEIINPLREQENSLRSNLLLGMAKSMKHNLNRNQSGLRFFEIADIYFKNKQGFSEIPALSLGVCGREEDFFYLKGALMRILNFLNIGVFEFKEESLNNFTNALGIFIGNKKIGFLGKLDKGQKNNLGLKEDLFFAQINLLLCVGNKSEKKYKPFSPYPAIWRDISISLKKGVKFKEVEEIIRKKGDYLAGLTIVDVYKGKDIPSGHKAFTLRIFYQSTEKTLTSDEVDTFHNQIRQGLSCQEGVSLR